MCQINNVLSGSMPIPLDASQSEVFIPAHEKLYTSCVVLILWGGLREKDCLRVPQLAFMAREIVL